MKRIEFVAPVESMRGNLSGSQKLDYRENNNPAYEAPDGDAHALNYQPRYVGAKRAKNGLKYFIVRTKSTTKLNAKTRKAMAILGVVAAMKSALKTMHAADWAKLQQAYAYQVEHGMEVPDTFDKWVSQVFSNMLRYNQEVYTFTQASISVSVYNPYASSASALVISTRVWRKFFIVLAGTLLVTNNVFSIDNEVFYRPDTAETWESLKDATAVTNPNWRATYANITFASAGSDPLYNGMSIFDPSGTIQQAETELDDVAYTTIAPTA